MKHKKTTSFKDKYGVDILDGDSVKYKNKTYKIRWSELFQDWFGCNEVRLEHKEYEVCDE